VAHVDWLPLTSMLEAPTVPLQCFHRQAEENHRHLNLSMLNYPVAWSRFHRIQEKLITNELIFLVGTKVRVHQSVYNCFKLLHKIICYKEDIQCLVFQCDECLNDGSDIILTSLSQPPKDCC
jgi:hypothetical protein